MGLGWDVTVMRLEPPITGPEDLRLVFSGRWERRGDLKTRDVGSWRAGVGGLQWLRDLCDLGTATCLVAHGGYPLVYLVRVADARAEIGAATAGRAPRSEDPGVEDLAPDEWLIVEAWDRS